MIYVKLLTNKNIKILFKEMNIELKNISEWLRANKLSINIDKTNFIPFHNNRDKDHLPLKLPTLFINDAPIKQVVSTKFLGVQIDENINWTQHITLTENKLAKQLGLLYKAKPFLNRKSMINLYFSFIHTYINYGNIAWASTTKTKLKKIHSQQKQAIKTVFNEDILSPSMKKIVKPLKKENEYLRESFPDLSEEKMKVGIFDEPQIRKMKNDKEFAESM